MRIVLLAWLTVVASADVLAQGTKADYERAAGLQGLTRNKVLRDAVDPQWIDGGRALWYRVRTGADAFEWIVVDARTGERRPAFDHSKVASALAASDVTIANADNLPLEQFAVDRAGDRVTFRAGGKAWEWQLKHDALKELPELPSNRDRGQRRRRDGGGDDTSLTFQNRSSGAVEVFWWNDAGERRSYGKIPAGGQHVQHTFPGHRWVVVDDKGTELGTIVGEAAPRTVEIPAELRLRPERLRGAAANAERRSSRSPDGRWNVHVRDHNLFLEDTTDNSETALTKDGVAEDHYGRGLFWSPDSRLLVAMKTQPAQTRTVNIVESSPKDQLQPKLIAFDYLKPGDRVAVSKPRLLEIAERKSIPLDDSLYAMPFAIRDVRWEADSSRFTFAYNQRGHQVFRILSVDAATGRVTPIVNEESKTFIDYSGKQFRHDVAGGEELIWMSERDGWNHLYLFNSKTGELKNQITQGEWVVRGVERVDDDLRQVWFRAGGIRPGQDPYFVHYARVNFDGTGLTILTEGNGQHAVEFSPDGETFVDTWSRVDLPPVTELRKSADGSLVCVLETADWTPLLETGWKAAERFVAKGRDGATDIYGVIWRPTNFDPAQKYPVIENIYAGPQSAFVPKSFRPYYPQQKIAELGFIVVQIDGMGTSHRSKAFHDVCWKNIGDSGFPDRMLWIKAAAKHEPAMDVERVGIYGGSAGGQNSTRALLAHGDFYKVAVSDCGCHDNRMDKIWWNEQWMGWPIGEHYAEQSNVTQAHKLTGKLLLVVGELDRNVDPASTMQVANALIKADRDFDLLVIPGAGHGACETPYGQRRRQDFFVRHLLGVEPRGE